MRERECLFDGWEFALCAGQEPEEGKDLDYKPVILPHDWMVSRPFDRDMRQGLPQGFFDRWGVGIYRRKLFVKKKPGMIYRLQFDGVYENCQVWVNGILAGGWKYGYTPFTLDITRLLAEGENGICVRVDNTAFPADRWYSGAGIYRMVWLETLPAEHLEMEEVSVKTKLSSDALELLVRLDHPGKKRIALTGHGLQLSSVTEGDLVILSDEKLKLWSAEEPTLYDLTVELLRDDMLVDALSFPVGLRTVSVNADMGLLVNNRAVKLKGVCLHQDAGCLGTAVTPEIWRARLEELKKIGCNALRLAHHLYMPEVLDLCDEMGFYVYEEPFDKWTAGAYGRYYESEWRQDLTAMVLRDRNRPSILVWGVGNEVENQGHSRMLELLGKHVDAVKALDRTRPVSLAMNPHFSYEERRDLARVEDIQKVVDEMKTGEILDIGEKVERIRRIADKVDILGCNYMEQWYQDIHRMIPDKPVLGTEIYQFFRGREELFQAYFDQCPWWDAAKNEWSAGSFIWTGIDYLGESAVWPAKGWSGSLFSSDMEKRPMAWAYQSFWTQTPMVHFAVLDMSLADWGTKEHWDAPRYVHHWSFPQYETAVVPYMVATNCERVEIRLNDMCYHPAPAETFPNRIIQGWLPWKPGEVMVIGFQGDREVCRERVITPGPAAALGFEEKVISVKLRRDSTGKIMPYQLLCKARALDAQGNPVFHKCARVRFTVEGPAQIVGTDNGDMKRAEPFIGSAVHLYCGQAAAAVRILKPGQIKVSVSAPGLKQDSMIIIAE